MINQKILPVWETPMYNFEQEAGQAENMKENNTSIKRP